MDKNKKKLKNILTEIMIWIGESVDLESDEEIEKLNGLLNEGYRLIDNL